MFTPDLFEKAYKKLKSNIYYDKTQLILRDQLVTFEHINSKNGDISNHLHKLYKKFTSDNLKEYYKFEREILDSISYLVFPKKLNAKLCNSEESTDASANQRDNPESKNKGKKEAIISNANFQKPEVSEFQYFIDMNIEGHILGVLWLMLIGYKIDMSFYEHSYGNRIRKNLYNEFSDEPTYSPYLFEPYFQQYESWRDKGLEEATKQLELNHDVFVITLDFKKFFYSIDLQQNAFNMLFESIISNNTEDYHLLSRLNNFVRKVIDQYASCFAEQFKRRHFLPIGFLPSNVLANWSLINFDKVIIEGWNPVYYGRYVDDILIIDKVERGSDVYKKAQVGDIFKEDIISLCLLQCTRWQGLNGPKCKGELISQLPLLRESKNDDKDKSYEVNSHFNPLPNDESKITLQNKKIKVFYFKSGESTSLIQCFRKEISKNKSEFRHLPEDEAFFNFDDYSDIYSMRTEESPNKLRGVCGITIDKYDLSKFLGRNLRIRNMIHDRVESNFSKDILKIFNSNVIIDNYTTWERLIELLMIEEQFETVEKFISKVIDSIQNLSIVAPEKKHVNKRRLQHTLLRYLLSALFRSSALVWKMPSEETYEAICERMQIDFNIQEELPIMQDMRKAYCATRMLNKSLMPIAYDMLNLDIDAISTTDINLTRFDDVLSNIKSEWESNYNYYPTLISMYDFSIISCLEQLQKSEREICWKVANDRTIEGFLYANYKYKRNKARTIGLPNSEQLVDVHDVTEKIYNGMGGSDSTIRKIYHVSVGDGKKSRLKIGIANTRIDSINFRSLVNNEPNRKYIRYKEIASMINHAIDEKVDMLVMPESCVPFEWLSFLASYSAKNDFAIITGVEHLILDQNVYNLTAVILPYTNNNHKFASISFHLKNFYAPAEKAEIHEFRYQEVAGNSYELFQWNDCYFPVYCCYELASIIDRSIFQSYADTLIAIEWNKDVNYFSSIIESLCRDVHCYCVQVNSSDYGDSRIVQPMKTEQRDLIKTKGGLNSTILVEYIDIDALRAFQIRENMFSENGERKGKLFKATPPGFNKDITKKKIRGENIF